MLTRDAAARLFGSADPIGKTIVIGNKVDTTVTGVIDAIPEPSQFGRSANAQLPFDVLASRDVYDAVRTNPFGLPPGAPMPPGAGWFMLGTFTYLYLPAAVGCRPIRSLVRSSTSARGTCRRRCCATRR